MGSGMSAVTVEALSAKDSSVSVIGTRTVSPQNFSVLHKGIEVLAGGGSEGGGGSKSSFLNTDIDLRHYIFPGYGDAFKLHPVRAHIIREVEEW